MPDWLLNLLDHYGYVIVFFAVFFNNTGIPVPGDTFLLGAGFLAEDGMFSLWMTILVGSVACFLGGMLSYWIGRRAGRKILFRIRFLHMTPEKIGHMERFLKRHGAKSVFFARFVGLVHPITGLLAGVGHIRFRPFMVYNLVGSVAYAMVYTFLGYFFGESWDILKAWLGRTGLYTFGLVLVFVLLTLFLRRPLANLLERFAKKPG